MYWFVVMFIVACVGFTVLGVTWINKDKPPAPPAAEYVPLASLDGHALCPGCKHPKVASHTVRRVTHIEEY